MMKHGACQAPQVDLELKMFTAVASAESTRKYSSILRKTCHGKRDTIMNTAVSKLRQSPSSASSTHVKEIIASSEPTCLARFSQNGGTLNRGYKDIIAC